MKIETKCIHEGYKPGNGEARALPIYQSTTWKYDTSEEMGKLFSIFETANNQDNDDDAWTDIMFRDKFWFMDTFREILANYKVAH